MPAQARQRDQPAPPLAERARRPPPPSSWNVVSSGASVWPCLPPDAEDQAAPDEEAAERDDERRAPRRRRRGSPAELPIERPEQRGRRPARRSRRTTLLGQAADACTSTPKNDDDPVGLDQRHRVAEEAEQRPDRQVDVARHDDEHHPRRHDGDGGALDRQVPQVAGRQEAAVRQEVEGDPDGDAGRAACRAGGCRSRSTTPSVAPRPPRLRRRARQLPTCFGVSTVAIDPPVSIGPRRDRDRPRPVHPGGGTRHCSSAVVSRRPCTEPAATPLQTLSLVVQPASMTTFRLSLVIGCGRQQDRRHVDAARAW